MQKSSSPLDVTVAFWWESRAEEAFFILKPYAKHAKVKLAAELRGCLLVGK